MFGLVKAFATDLKRIAARSSVKREIEHDALNNSQNWVQFKMCNRELFEEAGRGYPPSIRSLARSVAAYNGPIGTCNFGKAVRRMKEMLAEEDNQSPVSEVIDEVNAAGIRENTAPDVVYTPFGTYARASVSESPEPVPQQEEPETSNQREEDATTKLLNFKRF